MLIDYKKQENWLVALKEDRMSQLFTFCRIARMYQAFFPLSQDISRIDNLKVISGIIYAIKHTLQWKDAQRKYGSYKTLYSRCLT